MKYLFAAAILVTTAFAGMSAAEAAGGCGPGWHRGPYGGCVRNRGPVVVAPGPVVVRPPVVVAPRARVCPYGFVWRYGRCRPI
ncbi:GCG_CRPN prefix-to-repeats domain-containing protein [Bradyrhizobium sp. ORS 111]|uniref:GCG_CRPN prefix-to-repeats domain-containing protein n=1 Tax=Bradyrhizobium sp. ORS 111 TaxID=1685958 RepID=UPI00388FD457